MEEDKIESGKGGESVGSPPPLLQTDVMQPDRYSFSWEG
jgi:hypothetical protein